MATWLDPHLSAAGGRLRFDRFMELALYDPRHGYYTARISDVGRGADFSTAATLSTALGRAIAAWIRSHPEQAVIEVGAGNGALAAAVQGSLPFLLRRRRHWHIVERSPRLRLLQEKHLGTRTHWHETLPAAIAATGGEALIYSNEVPDAFPARVFRRAGEAETYEELHLTAGEQQTLVEDWQPADELPQSTVFDHPWPPGQRIEVHESVHHWLAEWTPGWRAGALLTIDYGGSPREIYHRRPGGTLRGYFLHQMITGPELLSNPGRQDLTADVNFDDLKSWGRELGLRTISRQSQSDFLAAHRVGDPADQFLLDPHGAGTAFQVLEQRPAP